METANAILATRFTSSLNGFWPVLAVAVASAFAVLLWVGILSRRWPLATFSTAFFLLFGFSAIWPGSPIFETWYQGRSFADGSMLVWGVVMLATGAGFAVKAVRNPSRAARASGFAFGVAFAGFVGYWFAAMAMSVINVDHAVVSPMSGMMISFLGHPAGWLAAYTGLRQLRYHGLQPANPPAGDSELPDNRWRWPIIGGLLGTVAAAGLAGVWLNVIHYEVFDTGRRNWTPSGLAYAVGMQLETLVLFVLPIVMALAARIGARERFAVPGRCQTCDYNLHGHRKLTSPVCPECGTSQDQPINPTN